MNPFRQLLRAAGGQVPLGTWIMSGSPIVAEAVGHAGFDWAVLDMEHSALDVAGVLAMLQALGSTRMVPLVRVPWNEPVVVKRVLDAGALTVLFPFVQTADEARAAVAATRYPPAGVRGMAGMSRATRFGTDPDYLRLANQKVGVVVQLESRLALQNLEAIAAEPGVDALFIGPADLSADMGHGGHTIHPKVIEAMADAVHRAKAVGKPIGTLGLAPPQVVRYRALGFDFIALSSDLGLLIHGARDTLFDLQSQGGDNRVHSLHGGTVTE
ncbi:MAG: HpcH/HpaI aldolase family protein [Rubrivivax sp.]|jgi:2-keto-3-deoxy-L-rhamnonate aldolase RhmA|nr:aldolase/citrate lyase family protein [Rubrivivax sp.]